MIGLSESASRGRELTVLHSEMAVFLVNAFNLPLRKFAGCPPYPAGFNALMEELASRWHPAGRSLQEVNRNSRTLAGVNYLIKSEFRTRCW